MVHKSKKLTAVYALIMDLPLSILITLISLLLAGNLAAPMFIRMAILAYVITFFVNFLPAPKFAIKHSKPGTFKFGLLLNIVVAAVFVVILDLIMTAVGVLVFGGGTFQMYIVSVLGGFIPCYIPTLIIAILWNGPADKMSRAIVGEPMPEIPTSF